MPQRPSFTHTLEAGSEPRRLLAPEWLLANGTGGYAAGTALGVNTRRYHGLLVGATTPPVGRVVAVNQVLDQLVLQSEAAPDEAPHQQVLEFSSLLFPGQDGPVFAPDGWQRLVSFEKGLTVRWTYAWGPIRVTRELIPHWKQQAVTLRYGVTGLGELPAHAAGRASLRLGPLLTLRDFHAVIRRDHTEPFHVLQRVTKRGSVLTAAHWGMSCTMGCVREDGAPKRGASPAAKSGRRAPAIAAPYFSPAEDWWYNVHYPIDQRRGQDCAEDYFLPGWFEAPLDVTGDNTITLTLALGDRAAEALDAPAERAKHLKPMTARLASDVVDQSSAGKQADEHLPALLAQAADDFVVDRKVGRRKLSTILAGYPWFADWGRDTFIALPGLLLCTGRFTEARDTLHAFAQSIGSGEHEGLVPNRFDDYREGAAHYNTVDASLWFVHAALLYREMAGDDEAWHDWLADACVRVVEAYAGGTAFDIRMDDDALITAGSLDTQLTWMDAAAHGPDGRFHVFTPRHGKAVEINALWHRALTGLSEALPDGMTEPRRRYSQLAKRVRHSFPELFWNEQRGCLFDHVIAGDDGSVHRDAAIRPNQALAVALPHSPLNTTQQRKVVAALRQALATPAGMRTLPEDDPNYHGWYHGPQFERDAAYHTGTIWPWLIGPYAEAILRAGRFSQRARDDARKAIAPLLRFARGRGLGQLYEVHQANPVDGAHPPRGCFAQAWSVAEVIRVMWLIRNGQAK